MLKHVSPIHMSGQYIFLSYWREDVIIFYDFGFIFACGIKPKNFDKCSDIIL